MKLDIEKISEIYGCDINGKHSEPMINCIDDCFSLLQCSTTGKYEEEPKECKYVGAEDIIASISDIILCCERLKELLEQDKFVDDFEVNRQIINEINWFMKAKGL